MVTRSVLLVEDDARVRRVLRLALEDQDPAAVHWWGERRRASADLLRSGRPPTDPTLARLLEDLRGTMTEIAERRSEGRSTHTQVSRQVQLELAVRDYARLQGYGPS